MRTEVSGKRYDANIIARLAKPMYRVCTRALRRVIDILHRTHTRKNRESVKREGRRCITPVTTVSLSS